MMHGKLLNISSGRLSSLRVNIPSFQITGPNWFYVLLSTKSLLLVAWLDSKRMQWLVGQYSNKNREYWYICYPHIRRSILIRGSMWNLTFFLGRRQRPDQQENEGR